MNSDFIIIIALTQLYTHTPFTHMNEMKLEQDDTSTLRVM